MLFYHGCTYLTTGAAKGWTTFAATIGTGATKEDVAIFIIGIGAGRTTGLTIFRTPGAFGVYITGTGGPSKIALAKTIVHKKA